MEFKIFGVKFLLSYPLVAIITLLLISDIRGNVLCAILSALCHELGHIIAMHFFGTKLTEIKLSVFDIGIVDVKKQQRNIKAEIIITLSGIFVNFVLFFLSFMLYNVCNFSLLKYFAIANLTLGIFNALPVDSLDGGTALQMILERNFSEKTVYFTTLIISLIIVIPLGFISFMLLLNSPYNFTFMFTEIYLVCVIIFKRKKYF